MQFNISNTMVNGAEAFFPPFLGQTKWSTLITRRLEIVSVALLLSANASPSWASKLSISCCRRQGEIFTGANLYRKWTIRQLRQENHLKSPGKYHLKFQNLSYIIGLWRYCTFWCFEESSANEDCLFSSAAFSNPRISSNIWDGIYYTYQGLRFFKFQKED